MGAAPSFSNLRPGYPICPPAVARHMVYRLRLDDNPHWPSDEQSPEDKWGALCEHFAEHVAELRHDYRNPEEQVEFREPGKAADAAADCFSLGASCLVPITKADEPDGYRLRVRIDVHTELVSLTYLFDRIVDGRLAECIAGLERDAPKARRESDWLLDGMWNADDGQEKQVAAASAVARWGERPISKRRPDRWNDVHITDFKGIIICPDPDWPMGKTQIGDGVAETRTKDGPPAHRRILVPALAVFAKRRDKLIRAFADPQSLDLEAGEPGDSVSRACVKGGEPVVCGMLDGAALYAAALGEWGADEKPHPIRHLLVYAGHSYSQVGRLVRRMHVLGELRHAALIDFDADDVESPAPGRRGLRETSRKLRSLGRKLTAYTPRITAAREEAAAAAPGAAGAPDPKTVPPFTAKEAMECLTAMVNELADVSDMVDGGLTHRIEQSRYYAGEFKATVEQLRIVRLGAWQPYDDFVQRYIVHLFARVDRIGNRYEALGRRVDRLLFFQQAKLLDRYTDNVVRTVDKIGKVTEALEKSARAQTHLLSAAEWFATVFLIYYAGSVVKYSVEAHQIPSLTKELYTLWWARSMSVASVLLVVYIVISKIGRWFAEREKRHPDATENVEVAGSKIASPEVAVSAASGIASP